MISTKLVFAVWAAIHPGIGTRGDGPTIAKAIVKVVDCYKDSVYEDSETDVAVMAYWAWYESNLNLTVCNSTGRSCGAWQQDPSIGKDAIAQALAWYRHLRYGTKICKNPAAVMWGSCNFKLVVPPYGTAEDAANLRIAEAKRLLGVVHAQED